MIPVMGLPRRKRTAVKGQESRRRTKEEMIAIAYHEAGHAVAAYCLGLWIEKVTIRRGKDYGGYVRHHREEGYDKDWFDLVNVVVAMCGPAAQARAGFPAGFECLDDSRVRETIMDEIADRYKDVDAYERLEDKTSARVAKILDDHWETVEALAGALLAHKTLSGLDLGSLLHSYRCTRQHDPAIRRLSPGEAADEASPFYGATTVPEFIDWPLPVPDEPEELAA